MAYFGTTINDSPVIAGVAASDMTGAEFLAVKFNENGKIVKASTAGEKALGLLGAADGDKKTGDTVTVQIKECALWKLGATVTAGAELATDASGKAVTATAGNYVLAIALEAGEADSVIKVQIVKSGYIPTEE